MEQRGKDVSKTSIDFLQNSNYVPFEDITSPLDFDTENFKRVKDSELYSDYSESGGFFFNPNGNEDYNFDDDDDLKKESLFQFPSDLFSYQSDLKQKYVDSNENKNKIMTLHHNEDVFNRLQWYTFTCKFKHINV